MNMYANTVDCEPLLIWILLGQKKVSLLVKCPDFRGSNVHRVFMTAKCVLFIDVSSLQSVLIKGFHCIIKSIMGYNAY